MSKLTKGMVIHFINRDQYETIIKGSTCRVTGMVTTDKKEYSNDFLSRWLDFKFIKVYTAKEFKELNLVM